ncbi:MAG: hypothetical protein AAGI12_15570 [Pseudomonadota bacterium]
MIVVTKTYGDIAEAARTRRHMLKLSCEAVDHRAGLAEGYTNKLENWDKQYGRTLGLVSLPLLLGALDLKVVICDSETADEFTRWREGKSK